MGRKRNKNRRNKEESPPLAEPPVPAEPPTPAEPPVPADSLAADECVLPQRIMWSILSRLPVKSLVRFKRVCEPFYDLHTNPSFITLHRNRFSQLPKTLSPKTQIITMFNLGMRPSRDRDFDPNLEHPLFLGSCKGLICIGRPLVTHRILLWNPATKLWKYLPPPIAEYYWRNADMVSLGFGCNEEGDDHKVVRIFGMEEDAKRKQVHVEVYSSKSDSWKELNVGFNFRLFSVGNHAVVNGNPHWVVFNEDGEAVMLRFDSEKMLLETTCLPNDIAGEQVTFVDWEGHVAGLHCVKRRGDLLESVDVWEYEEESKTWKKNLWYKFEGAGLRVDACLDYNPGKRKIVGRCTSGGLFEIDLKRGGEVNVFGEVKGQSGVFKMFAYEESLAYVSGMSEMKMTWDFRGFRTKECIRDGFFTCLNPQIKQRDIEIYYGVAF